MRVSKDKVMEIETMVINCRESIHKDVLEAIFHDMKSELEYWWAMYDDYEEECRDILNK